jgi:hypothetical protein
MLKLVLMLIDLLISIYKSETDARGKEVQFLKERNAEFEGQLQFQLEKESVLRSEIDKAHKKVVVLEKEYLKLMEEITSISISAKDKMESNVRGEL